MATFSQHALLVRDCVEREANRNGVVINYDFGDSDQLLWLHSDRDSEDIELSKALIIAKRVKEVDPAGSVSEIVLCEINVPTDKGVVREIGRLIRSFGRMKPVEESEGEEPGEKEISRFCFLEPPPANQLVIPLLERVFRAYPKEVKVACFCRILSFEDLVA